MREGKDGNKMKEYVKTFLHRGLIFGGFGPIVMAIVYLILSLTMDDFSLTGKEAFFAIISVYALAFIQAGASIFNQIESWSIGKSLLIHLSVLYFTYVLCYLANTWLPFEPIAVLIFTAVFIAVYAVIWITVFLVVRNTSKKLNQKI
jgi:hypothetical protein